MTRFDDMPSWRDENTALTRYTMTSSLRALGAAALAMTLAVGCMADPAEQDLPDGGELLMASHYAKRALGVEEWQLYKTPDGDQRIVGYAVGDSISVAAVDVLFRANNSETSVIFYVPGESRLTVSIATGDVLYDDLSQEQYNILSILQAELLRADGVEETADVAYSHQSSGCYLAAATAGTSCAACPFSGGLVCGSCALAIAAMGVACSNGHCDQVSCNSSCTTACHRYGWCPGGGGSGAQTDCQCHGFDATLPGCGAPPPPPDPGDPGDDGGDIDGCD